MERHPSDFRIKDVLATLESLALSQDPASDAYFCIELAAKSLAFIQSTQRLSSFREYLKDFDTEARNINWVSHTFPDLGEAKAWAERNPESALGAIVKVVDTAYIIVKGDGSSLTLRRTFLPQDLEEDQE